MAEKFAILMDGGFVKKKLQRRHGRFPTVQDVAAEVARIKAHPSLSARELLRAYFYDAPPASGRLVNPISGTEVNLAASAFHAMNISLQQGLEMLPDFALRQGEVAVHGWELGQMAMKSIVDHGPRQLQPNDLVPAIEQKGVDLRIGLDIARLSLLKFVDVIVAVTGDSDIVPAFRFARREGVRVYLDHMGHNVRRELKAHTDLVLE